jgi:group I intron endonuclease
MARRHKLIGIYRIECLSSGKVYIGSSKDICMRWSSHLLDLIMGRHHNQGMQDDFRRYGLPGFKFTILKLVDTVRGLKMAEQVEMDQVDLRKLYNMKRAVAKR